MGGGGVVGFVVIVLVKVVGCYVVCICGKRSMEKVKEVGVEEVVDYIFFVSYYDFID